MPEPAVESVVPVVEIMPPQRLLAGKTVICACCRQAKLQREFDEDCCGICEECLCSDAICFEME